MTRILFSPHNDDAALWASFLIMEWNPIVVMVLRSKKQELYGISHATREGEDAAAMHELGVSHYEQWPEPDVGPDQEAILAMVRELKIGYPDVTDVFAPAVEEGGHEQHNMVGEITREVFGDQVTEYLTYTRHRGRSAHGIEIVPEPWMIPSKLRALACYQSQMHPETGCQSWFMDGIREFVVS